MVGWGGSSDWCCGGGGQGLKCNIIVVGKVRKKSLGPCKNLWVHFNFTVRPLS